MNMWWLQTVNGTHQGQQQTYRNTQISNQACSSRCLSSCYLCSLHTVSMLETKLKAKPWCITLCTYHYCKLSWFHKDNTHEWIYTHNTTISVVSCCLQCPINDLNPFSYCTKHVTNSNSTTKLNEKESRCFMWKTNLDQTVAPLLCRNKKEKKKWKYCKQCHYSAHRQYVNYGLQHNCNEKWIMFNQLQFKFQCKSKWLMPFVIKFYPKCRS